MSVISKRLQSNFTAAWTVSLLKKFVGGWGGGS